MIRHLLASALLAGGACVYGAPTKNVLVVFADEPGMPAVAQFTNSLRNTLKAPEPAAVSIYTEYLDLGRIGGSAYGRSAARWYDEKYSGIHLDAIVAGSHPALAFLLAHRDALWSKVPIVFTAVAPSQLDTHRLPPEVTGVYTATEFDETLEIGLRLFPRTRLVAVVSGSSQRDRNMREMSVPLREKYKGRLEWEELSGLTTDELRRRLAALPQGCIVLWNTVNADAAGRTFVPREALALLAPASSAPIFAPFGTYLGAGIVGGSLMDLGRIGEETARMVLEVLRRGSASQVPPITSRGRSVKFDWRQLQKWRIPESALPLGSEVQFRVPSYWEDHKAVLLGSVAFGLAETTLIVVLLIERRRRSSSERALHLLSGRLITAQEDERRRIARELHDDVNQRLALLSIELDQLRDDDRSAGIRPRLQRLSAKTADLSVEVHNLSRELHPFKLEHLGLVPAVRDFCRELESRHEIQVEFNAGDVPEDLSSEMAICLYRVLQEALRNVVTHSGARHAAVTIKRENGRVLLKVADKGAGFDPDPLLLGKGLGLIAMRERLGLVQGEIVVRSAPGIGTEIVASVPVPKTLPAGPAV
jgi:signal transduction histidine kinase